MNLSKDFIKALFTSKDVEVTVSKATNFTGPSIRIASAGYEERICIEAAMPSEEQAKEDLIPCPVLTVGRGSEEIKLNHHPKEFFDAYKEYYIKPDVTEEVLFKYLEKVNRTKEQRRDDDWEENKEYVKEIVEYCAELFISKMKEK